MLKILADILDDEYNIHIEATDLPPIHIHNQRRPSRAFFSRASFSQVYGHTMGPINCGIGGQHQSNLMVLEIQGASRPSF